MRIPSALTALFCAGLFGGPARASGTTIVDFAVTSASIRPDTTPIPLPAAGWLMVAGLGGLAARRRHS